MNVCVPSKLSYSVILNVITLEVTVVDVSVFTKLIVIVKLPEAPPAPAAGPI